jgi:hypothetical protein
VEVVISETAREHIVRHGGTVFVRSHLHRCCTDALTLLDVTTAPPREWSDFQSFDVDDVAVQFRSPGGFPNQLTIEMRGFVKPHPVAFWDGCAYRP